MIPGRFFVGGEWARPSRAATIGVTDPSTGERFAEVPKGGAVDARAAVHAARWACTEGPWRRMHPAERGAALTRFAVEVALRKQDLTEMEIRETGCTRRATQSLLVVPPIEALAWYAERAARDTETRLPDHAGPPPASSVLVREPMGVVCVIGAGAEPLASFAHRVLPALAAGNTVVYKAPSRAPLSAFVLAECAERADLPPGVLNIVAGPGRDAGHECAANTLVDAVACAGTIGTGRRVSEAAAPALKSLQLTLGAPGTQIVLAGARPDELAQHVVASWLLHGGQAWGAGCRLIVERSVHDEWVDAIVQEVKALSVGDPGEWSTHVGPLAHAAARDRVEAIARQAVQDGATRVAGGGRPEHRPQGYFLEPAVLTGVTPAMRGAREEIAGPLLAILVAADEGEAVALAAEPAGPAAWVWGSGRDEALAVARRVGAATVYAQGGGPNPWAPSGGYGRSGIGRAGGTIGIESFTEIKHISAPG